jgi:hypothetical protein
VIALRYPWKPHLQASPDSPVVEDGITNDCPEELPPALDSE